jgi:formylglycine-generating enzyme required for sulfatase activity
LGEPSIALPKRRGFVVRSDCETLTFEAVTRPDWASAMGRDRYGLWVEFSLGAATQRMRWVAPGRFRMGSPDKEEGRFSDEGPQHDVTLTKGYWVADAPVTQALWQEVMSGNPSRFTDPMRPVEQVSWDDAMLFLKRINQMIPVLDLVLPTEAQWEYACRAGRDMPTYARDGESALNMIAWYEGNNSQQTQPIKQKLPNGWGLYDMLGNVWEWCADDLRSYGSDAASDPVGSLDSAQRALRGGSWDDLARDVRAANRVALVRVARDFDFGFRCARVRP